MPHLTLSLPTFSSSHCCDNQLPAGMNLMAHCLSGTLLSFEFYLGLLRGSACRNLFGTHTGADSIAGSSSPTRQALTNGGRGQCTHLRFILHVFLEVSEGRIKSHSPTVALIQEHTFALAFIPSLLTPHSPTPVSWGCFPKSTNCL